MKAPKGISIWFSWLFWSLPIIYFFLYGRYGFADTDQGFIQALSWRIQCGQIPYIDFYYVRPPLSPILHALEMGMLPENYVIIGSRLIFYLSMALSVFFTVQTLKKVFGQKRFPLNWNVFACIALVISIHNYPPMPWHSVDGILFASMGFFLLSRGHGRAWILGGMFALFLAALSKQPFYLAPIAAVIWLAMQPRGQGYNPRWKLALLSLIGFSCLFVGAMWLIHPDMPGRFISQTTGSTSIYDLFAAGVIPYLKPSFILLLILGARLVQQRFFEEIQWSLIVLSNLLWIYVGLAMFLTMFSSSISESFQAPLYGWPMLMTLAAGFWSLRFLPSQRKEASLLLVLLMVSWASGISWGYATPILYFTPVFAGTLLFTRDILDQKFKWNYGIIMLGFFLAGFFFLYQTPYRDVPKKDCNFALDDIFPRMEGIQTGVYNYEKNKNLKRLLHQHQGHFMIMPSMPIVHYLTNEPPPRIADWIHNGEINWKKNEEEIIMRLSTEVATVFLEIDKMDELENSGKYGAKLAAFVESNWRLEKQTGYFLVYKNPLSE